VGFLNKAFIVTNARRPNAAPFRHVDYFARL
jgi:hypothetical protein